MVFTRPIAGKKLLGTAGRHSVVTDRKVTDDGTDAGCTSGELLLLAMASCATGSIRSALAARGTPLDDMRVDVDFVPPKQASARDGILVSVFLPPAVLADGTEPILAAVAGGGVCSRIKLGSDIDIRCLPLEDAPKS
jgi:OsmC-like protein